MTLLVPTGAQAFGALQSNFTGRPTSAPGTVVTPVIGSKGAYASAIASVTNDTFGIIININSNSASATIRNTVLDIGIDTAGGTEYTVRLPDILCGGAVGYTVAPGGIWYYFPIFIPAGARVGLRAQSNATNTFRVYLQLLQRPVNQAMVRAGSVVEAIGLSALPAGTAIVPGTTAEGAWTLMGSTTHRLWWWQLGVQLGLGDTTVVNAILHFDVAVGDGTNFQIVAENIPVSTNTAEAVGIQALTVGQEFDIPAGSSIYVRAQNSTTNDLYNCAVYGLGG